VASTHGPPELGHARVSVTAPAASETRRERGPFDADSLHVHLRSGPQVTTLMFHVKPT